MTAPCMGGWCTRRDHCANYHAASVDQQPAERLCPPGRDGAGLQPMDESMMKFSTQERVAQAVSVLVPSGIQRAAIGIAIGVTSPARLWQIMSEAERQGLAFGTFAKVSEEIRGAEMVYFPTAADREAFRATYDAEMKRRQQARDRAKKRSRVKPRQKGEPVSRAQKRAEERAKRQAEKLREIAERKAMAVAEAELAKQRKRLEREAAAAQKARDKAEAKSLQKRLKAETKAAGQVAKPRGTASPAPVKPRGPAMLPGQPDLSRARITIAPPMRDRWASDAPPRVVASNECRSWAEAAAA